MARHSTYLALILVMGLLVVQTLPGAYAQNGSCPGNTVSIPAPAGTYPSGMKLCVLNSAPANFTSIYDPTYPCQSAMKIHQTFEAPLVNGMFDPFAIVPPASMAFSSNSAKIRFQVSVDDGGGAVPAIRADSYNANNARLEQKIISFSGAPLVIGSSGQSWYRPEFNMVMEPGGYVIVQLTQPTGTTLPDVYFSGFQLSDTSSLPAPCEVPGAVWPTSPAPTATSPADPTHTPGPTAWPTSPGTTQTPAPTSTAYTPIEIPAESTGTPLPLPSLPEVVFPAVNMPGDISFGSASMPGNISYPTVTFSEIPYPDVLAPPVPSSGTPVSVTVGLTPNATAIYELAQVDQWVIDSRIVVDRWSGATNASMGWMNPDITSTTAISTPAQIAYEMSLPVTLPIRYIRAISVYMPNIWKYIFIIFLMLIWIFLNLMAKFGGAIISEILDFIRRVIELIPGF